MTGLRVAIGFLTVLPVPHGAWQPAHAVAWYPLVGVALAAVAGPVAFGASEVASPPLAAAITIAAWVALTGGLHLDGLADSADGAFAQVSRERRLAILRDVHHGTFAMLAIGVVLLLKYGGLAALDARAAAAAVALAIVTARGSLPFVMRAFPGARPDGFGAESRAGATAGSVAFGLAVGILGGVITFGFTGVSVALGAGVVAWVLGKWLCARLGGLTGDTYGAVVESVETAVLAAVSILVTNGHATAFPAGRLI